MKQEAYFCRVKELNELGKENIPKQLISHTHLIYSSPATLAFNSPGAEGFGVKRAGLAVPDSIMLIVSPGCCGRNTSVLSSMGAYHDRFYYLLMDETDIVTGRHLKKIPKAVAEICEGFEKKPSVVMICITCVDALLGTDMERVCHKAEEYARNSGEALLYVCIDQRRQKASHGAGSASLFPAGAREEKRKCSKFTGIFFAAGG